MLELPSSPFGISLDPLAHCKLSRGIAACLEEIDLRGNTGIWSPSPTRHATLVVCGGNSQVLLEVICEVALVGETCQERGDRWKRSFR